MNRLRKLLKWALFLLVLLVAANVAVTFALRTRRMHAYLVAHLERAFGRPVEVNQFSAQIFPLPRLEMAGITVGEDPRFGNEYFLRAESMQASLRWLGLLRGNFEFGTMSLTRPSLILVRNPSGQWNLEGWLPPAEPKSAPAPGPVAGSKASRPVSMPGAGREAASPSNYLERIEFDDGRISFKTGDDKRAFAFTDVSGSVEQTGPGRWQLRLEAKPWRSGVVLQSAGLLYVLGEVAGTSSRLQPAQLQVHWDRVSLADLSRLITGNDSGVRGEFGLDGTASVGLPADGTGNSPEAAPPPAVAGKWKFQVEGWAAEIHRWDLTERSDNPRVSVGVKGEWDLRTSQATAREIRIDLPHSNLRGAGKFETTREFPWRVQIGNAAVEAQDLLAWYRAFEPEVAEQLSAEQFFSAAGIVHGWPLRWETARLESGGGVLHVPGITEPLTIAEVHGELLRDHFSLSPVRITAIAGKAAGSSRDKQDKAATRSRDFRNWAEIKVLCADTFKSGEVRVEGHLDQPQVFFQSAAAFGKTLNHGWELSGPVSGLVGWDWDRVGLRPGQWSGGINFAEAELQAAGLNQPIVLDDARLEWKAGQRYATINSAEAFGATWSGTVGETRATIEGDVPRWQFHLHADHLDAAELDRWAGPRARPNWLQRLLPSLLGNRNAGAKPSELLRRVSAEGELSVDTVSVEKIKLSRAHATMSLQDLHLSVREAQAEWAGGTVRGEMQAVFSVSPKYEIAAEVAGVNLALMPWAAGWEQRWNGIASGRIQLTAVGVGREDLLSRVAGSGEIRLKNVDFRGWDVPGSLDSGAARTGTSHWSSGEGDFEVKDREARFAAIELDGLRAQTIVGGRVGFGQDVTLEFSSGTRVMKVSGTLGEPKVVVEKLPVAAKK